MRRKYGKGKEWVGAAEAWRGIYKSRHGQAQGQAQAQAQLEMVGEHGISSGSREVWWV